MLGDALVERYSRQILLPEVGGRGQMRLLAARVAVTGDDDAGRFAATLLAGAGVGVEVLAGRQGEIEIATGLGTTVVGRWHAGAGIVATLVGRPCAHCIDATALAMAPGDPATPAGCAVARAVGALGAAEALRGLLGLATGGRLQTFDMATGRFGGATLVGGGCAACDGRA